jgi:hypothetical protein
MNDREEGRYNRSVHFFEQINQDIIGRRDRIKELLHQVDLHSHMNYCVNKIYSIIFGVEEHVNVCGKRKVIKDTIHTCLLMCPRSSEFIPRNGAKEVEEYILTSVTMWYYENIFLPFAFESSITFQKSLLREIQSDTVGEKIKKVREVEIFLRSIFSFPRKFSYSPLSSPSPSSSSFFTRE